MLLKYHSLRAVGQWKNNMNVQKWITFHKSTGGPWDTGNVPTAVDKFTATIALLPLLSIANTTNTAGKMSVLFNVLT